MLLSQYKMNLLTGVNDSISNCPTQLAGAKTAVAQLRQASGEIATFRKATAENSMENIKINHLDTSIFG